MFFNNNEMNNIIQAIESGAASAMGMDRIILTEVKNWIHSRKRQEMIEGQRYYENESDILYRKKYVFNENGQLVEEYRLTNNRLNHGFTKLLVDQKVQYLLTKPFSYTTQNNAYTEQLKIYLNDKFQMLLQSIGKESVNKGISWIHPYYDEQGNFRFKRIPSEQLIPLWKDADHTELDAMIRVYDVVTYEGESKVEITKVEFWDTNGIFRYVLQDKKIIPDVEIGFYCPHIRVFNANAEEQAFNWSKVPFIAFKYNEEELPLLRYIKSIADDYDKHKSDNSSNLEDLPKDIFVVKGFEDSAAELRRNLNVYRVIKLSGPDTSIETKSLNIDAEAYTVHQTQNRKDIFEFGRGVDNQNQTFGNSPSGIALKFIYQNLDMDANTIETNFKSALIDLLWFINSHIKNTTGQDYFNETVEFIFNRDVMINENDAVKNAKDSVGIISNETIVANHPWITNAQDEMQRLEDEKKQQEEDLYGTMTNQDTQNNSGV